jgi:hypothetical protein
MKSERQRNWQDLLVFTLLVAIGVTGRWGEPTWCFTPVAAAALFAGLYFSRLAIALLVPIATLAITDLALPAHSNLTVLIATYAIMTAPVFLGRLQRGEQSPWRSAAKWALFGLVPATLFYIVTNFAVWAFQSDYETSLSGLIHCYWAAVPFYRAMIAGDAFYLAMFLSCWAMAGAPRQVAKPAYQVVRSQR